ncbi:MAG: hypothetical protein M0025_05705 [Elusimicrobia bacterium]|nr:hypothetical protein [Elusimicrobiota bacterium]
MDNNDAQKRPARPALVWIIGVFYALSALWTGLAYYLLLAGKVQLTPLQQQYYEGLTAADYAVTAVIVLLNLLGAGALLALRRSAFWLFAAGLAVSVGSTAWELAAKDWVQAFGGSGIAGMAGGWVIAAGVCFYARRLASRGVLN